MDSIELQKLAERSRSMREAGMALILASAILALFIFIPRSFETTPAPAVAVATSTTPDAFASVAVQAKAAIVYDLATGKVLYAKNAEAQLPLASLTKLLTVYAAFAELSPTTPVTIPTEVTRLDMPRAFNLKTTVLQ